MNLIIIKCYYLVLLLMASVDLMGAKFLMRDYARQVRSAAEESYEMSDESTTANVGGESLMDYWNERFYEDDDEDDRTALSWRAADGSPVRKKGQLFQSNLDFGREKWASVLSRTTYETPTTTPTRPARDRDAAALQQDRNGGVEQSQVEVQWLKSAIEQISEQRFAEYVPISTFTLPEDPPSTTSTPATTTRRTTSRTTSRTTTLARRTTPTTTTTPAPLIIWEGSTLIPSLRRPQSKLVNKEIKSLTTAGAAETTTNPTTIPQATTPIPPAHSIIVSSIKSQWLRTSSSTSAPTESAESGVSTGVTKAASQPSTTNEPPALTTSSVTAIPARPAQATDSQQDHQTFRDLLNKLNLTKHLDNTTDDQPLLNQLTAYLLAGKIALASSSPSSPSNNSASQSEAIGGSSLEIVTTTGRSTTPWWQSESSYQFSQLSADDDIQYPPVIGAEEIPTRLPQLLVTKLRPIRTKPHNKYHQQDDGRVDQDEALAPADTEDPVTPVYQETEPQVQQEQGEQVQEQREQQPYLSLAVDHAIVQEPGDDNRTRHSIITVNIWNYLDGKLNFIGQQQVPSEMLQELQSTSNSDKIVHMQRPIRLPNKAANGHKASGVKVNVSVYDANRRPAKPHTSATNSTHHHHQSYKGSQAPVATNPDSGNQQHAYNATAANNNSEHHHGYKGGSHEPTSAGSNSGPHHHHHGHKGAPAATNIDPADHHGHKAAGSGDVPEYMRLMMPPKEDSYAKPWSSADPSPGSSSVGYSKATSYQVPRPSYGVPRPSYGVPPSRKPSDKYGGGSGGDGAATNTPKTMYGGVGNRSPAADVSDAPKTTRKPSGGVGNPTLAEGAQFVRHNNTLKSQYSKKGQPQAFAIKPHNQPAGPPSTKKPLNLQIYGINSPPLDAILPDFIVDDIQWRQRSSEPNEEDVASFFASERVDDQDAEDIHDAFPRRNAQGLSAGSQSIESGFPTSLIKRTHLKNKFENTFNQKTTKLLHT